MEPVPVSVIIAAHNEATEIAACVASVDWAAEVIVVENDSTDDTVALATAAGATVFRHPFSTIGAQRNAAIARASRDWVLVVDADERGTPALGDAVRSTIARGDARAAYRARRRNFFMGREIRHGGWERDMPIRLFRRELRYDERSVHEHVIVTDAVGVLDEALAAHAVRLAAGVLRKAAALFALVGGAKQRARTSRVRCRSAREADGALPLHARGAQRVARRHTRRGPRGPGIHERRRQIRATLGALSQTSMSASLLDTPFTRQVGVELPIIGGAMYPCSNPELVAAVSAAGGIGVVQPVSLTYVHGYQYREGLRYIREIADERPIGMNALIEQGSKHYRERMERFIETSLEEGVRFFVTSLGNPRWVVDRVTPVGGIVYHDVTERKWAQKGLDAGVHGLICVNSRAGGHAGLLTPEQMYDDLAPLGVPLVCAGGIGEADEFVAALRMGYAAVQLGTRFIASAECSAHHRYKAAIVGAVEDDVVLTERLTGIPVAVLNTPYVQRLGLRAGPISRWMLRNRRTKHFMRTMYMLRSFFALKRSLNRGDEDRDYWQAGKSVSTITSVEPVASILNRFATAARAVAALLLLVLSTALGAQARPTLALVGGRVLDGYGGPPIENGVVLIAGDRIVAVGRDTDVRVPAGVPTVDTNGMTVLPGLIDMHVHLQILGARGLQALERSVRHAERQGRYAYRGEAAAHGRCHLCTRPGCAAEGHSRRQAAHRGR